MASQNLMTSPPQHADGAAEAMRGRRRAWRTQWRRPPPPRLRSRRRLQPPHPRSTPLPRQLPHRTRRAVLASRRAYEPFGDSRDPRHSAVTVATRRERRGTAAAPVPPPEATRRLAARTAASPAIVGAPTDAEGQLRPPQRPLAAAAASRGARCGAGRACKSVGREERARRAARARPTRSAIGSVTLRASRAPRGTPSRRRGL